MRFRLAEKDAGEAALRLIEKRNGGRLPFTRSEAIWLPREFGLGFSIDNGDTSILRVDDETTATVIVGRRMLPDDEKAGIIHEVIEWICRSQEFPSLVDLMYPVEYFFDGRDNPKRFGHRAAAWGEKLYRKWLEGQK